MSKVNVLFHEGYTVKNDDGDFYRAGEVYEMTAEQAQLFHCWCACEVTDRPPTARPLRTGKRAAVVEKPRALSKLAKKDAEWLNAVLGPAGDVTRNG